MKRPVLPIVLLVLVLGAIAALQYLQHSPRTGYEAPDFTLPDLSGKMYHLADMRGQVVFLNIWTTWCPPCRQEMPGMEVLYRRLRDRDFAMLAVSEDTEGAPAVVPFVEELGLTFPVLIDPKVTLSPRYGVTGYPETFIIDRDGVVVEHFIGPTEWNSQERLSYFHELLAKPASSDASDAARN